jgi:hypothetical protein
LQDTSAQWQTILTIVDITIGCSLFFLLNLLPSIHRTTISRIEKKLTTPNLVSNLYSALLNKNFPSTGGPEQLLFWLVFRISNLKEYLREANRFGSFG